VRTNASDDFRIAPSFAAPLEAMGALPAAAVPPFGDAPFCDDDYAKQDILAAIVSTANASHRRPSALVIKARMNSPLNENAIRRS
jgi:hypothetical protein